MLSRVRSLSLPWGPDRTMPIIYVCYVSMELCYASMLCSAMAAGWENGHAGVPRRHDLPRRRALGPCALSPPSDFLLALSIVVLVSVEHQSLPKVLVSQREPLQVKGLCGTGELTMPFGGIGPAACSRVACIGL